MTCYDCAYLGFDRNEVVGMAEMCNHPGNGFLVLDLLTVNMNVNFSKRNLEFLNGIHIPKMKKNRH